MNLYKTLTNFSTMALDKNQEPIRQKDRYYEQVQVKKNDILVEIKTLEILNFKITLFFHVNSNSFIRDENDEWLLVKI